LQFKQCPMNKHKHILFIFFAFACIFITSCGKHTSMRVTPVAVDEPAKPGFTAGTVKSYALDGCTWMIFLENGTILQPSGLTPEFQQNELKVWIKYTVPKDAMSICMAGQPVNITAIEIRK